MCQMTSVLDVTVVRCDMCVRLVDGNNLKLVQVRKGNATVEHLVGKNTNNEDISDYIGYMLSNRLPI